MEPASGTRVRRCTRSVRRPGRRRTRDRAADEQRRYITERHTPRTRLHRGPRQVNDARRRALYAIADAVGDLLDLLDRVPTTHEPPRPREPLRLTKVAEVAVRLGSSRSSV